MSHGEPRLPSYPPGGPTAVAPARAQRPPHAAADPADADRPLDRHRLRRWAAFARSVRPGRGAHHVPAAGPVWLPIGLLMAAGVFIPVALRRRAPVMAFGGLLILGVLFGDMATGLATATAATVVALIFLSAAYVLYTVTVDQQQADRRGRARPGARAHGVHRRHRAQPRRRRPRRRARPGRAGQRHRLDDRLLGAAAPPVRGAAAAAGREQRGRRRAAADRHGNCTTWWRTACR